MDLKPSRLEHPKYSTDKLLNCQHDWSHADKGADMNSHVDIATVNLGKQDIIPIVTGHALT